MVSTVGNTQYFPQISSLQAGSFHSEQYLMRHRQLVHRVRSGDTVHSRSSGLSLEALEGRCVPTGFAIGDATIAEGTSGTRFVELAVTLPAPATKSVQVDFQTVAGSARAGSDFGAVSGTLTFARGQSRQIIRVPVIGDRVPEFSESFDVVLQRARGAKIADGRGTVTILDSSPRISIAAPSFALDGRDGRGGVLTFTVSLSTAYDRAVSVQFQTADGISTPGLADRAVAGEDYVAASGLLTFAPGETKKTISIQVLSNVIPEYDEYFRVFLFNATEGLLTAADASADGWILGSIGTPPGEFVG